MRRCRGDGDSGVERQSGGRSGLRKYLLLKDGDGAYTAIYGILNTSISLISK
jgi:hypothetical protein